MTFFFGCAKLLNFHLHQVFNDNREITSTSLVSPQEEQTQQSDIGTSQQSEPGPSRQLLEEKSIEKDVEKDKEQIEEENEGQNEDKNEDKNEEESKEESKDKNKEENIEEENEREKVNEKEKEKIKESIGEESIEIGEPDKSDEEEEVLFFFYSVNKIQ